MFRNNKSPAIPPGLMPPVELLCMGILSSSTLLLARLAEHNWHAIVWADSFLTLLLPVAVLCSIAAKNLNTILAAADSPRSNRLIQLIVAASIAFALALQWLERAAGYGDANELVALLALQAGGWTLFVFSNIQRVRNVAFVFSSTVVLFVCFSADQWSVLICAALYGAATLWWMIGTYWSRGKTCIAMESTNTVQYNWFVLVISLSVLGVAASTSWGLVGGNTWSVPGVSYFSGGESGSEGLYARDGVGDGRHLTAGENATSVGAVKSDQFIEDDKPSLYDAMSEKYEAPAEIRPRTHRAVAINEIGKHVHELVQSEQSGRTFRTIRQSSPQSRKQLKNKLSGALFYVEGPVPVRLGVDCFHHFDGIDWSKRKLTDADRPIQSIGIESRSEIPWYLIRNVDRDYLTTERNHRIKLVRLETGKLPSPPFLQRWQIDRVALNGLFFFDDAGWVSFQGKAIPSQTVVDLVSHLPNLEELRTRPFLVDECFTTDGKASSGQDILPAISQNNLSNNDRNKSIFLQLPETPCRKELVSIAQRWTEGIPPGYQQVEAIVQRLRTEFRCDSKLNVSRDQTDSVASFLEQGGGPPYQFATVGTLLLRAAGYRSRLVTGFLLDRDDYDWASRQSIATAENIHLWPEVCLDGWHWIPVEATPGYPEPRHDETLVQWARRQITACWLILADHPVITAFNILFLVFVIRSRWLVIGLLGLMFWYFKSWISPHQLVSTTRKLIDFRFRLAGYPRPPHAPVATWYQQVDPDLSDTFSRIWNEINFGGERWNASSSRTKDICRQMIQTFGITAIKSCQPTGSPTKKEHR